MSTKPTDNIPVDTKNTSNGTKLMWGTAAAVFGITMIVAIYYLALYIRALQPAGVGFFDMSGLQAKLNMITTLESQVRDLTALRDKLQASSDDYNSKYTALQATVASDTAAYQTAMTELKQKYDTDTAALAAQIQQLSQGTIVMLQKELDNDKNTVIPGLNSQIETLTAANAKLTADLATANAKYATDMQSSAAASATTASAAAAAASAAQSAAVAAAIKTTVQAYSAAALSVYNSVTAGTATESAATQAAAAAATTVAGSLTTSDLTAATATMTHYIFDIINRTRTAGQQAATAAQLTATTAQLTAVNTAISDTSATILSVLTTATASAATATTSLAAAQSAAAAAVTAAALDTTKYPVSNITKTAQQIAGSLFNTVDAAIKQATASTVTSQTTVVQQALQAAAAAAGVQSVAPGADTASTTTAAVNAAAASIGGTMLNTAATAIAQAVWTAVQSANTSSAATLATVYKSVVAGAVAASTSAITAALANAVTAAKASAGAGYSTAMDTALTSVVNAQIAAVNSATATATTAANTAAATAYTAAMTNTSAAVKSYLATAVWPQVTTTAVPVKGLLGTTISNAAVAAAVTAVNAAIPAAYKSSQLDAAVTADAQNQIAAANYMLTVADATATANQQLAVTAAVDANTASLLGVIATIVQQLATLSSTLRNSITAAQSSATSVTPGSTNLYDTNKFSYDANTVASINGIAAKLIATGSYFLTLPNNNDIVTLQTWLPKIMNLYDPATNALVADTTNPYYNYLNALDTYYQSRLAILADAIGVMRTGLPALTALNTAMQQLAGTVFTTSNTSATAAASSSIKTQIANIATNYTAVASIAVPTAPGAAMVWPATLPAATAAAATTYIDNYYKLSREYRDQIAFCIRAWRVIINFSNPFTSALLPKANFPSRGTLGYGTFVCGRNVMLVNYNAGKYWTPYAPIDQATGVRNDSTKIPIIELSSAAFANLNTRWNIGLLATGDAYDGTYGFSVKNWAITPTIYDMGNGPTYSGPQCTVQWGMAGGQWTGFSITPSDAPWVTTTGATDTTFYMTSRLQGVPGAAAGAFTTGGLIADPVTMSLQWIPNYKLDPRAYWYLWCI